MASNWQKHITPTNIGLVAGALFLLMYMRRMASGAPNSQESPVSTDPFAIGRSQAEIDSIARSQYAAMDRIGTDEDVLFDSLEGLSANDLKRVFNAFGVKKYMLFGGSALFAKPLDLFGWYREELNGSELKRMRAVWAKAGMTI